MKYLLCVAFSFALCSASFAQPRSLSLTSTLDALGLTSAAGISKLGPAERSALETALNAAYELGYQDGLRRRSLSGSRRIDYEVDLGLVLDFEDIRPLIEQCLDPGELEEVRTALESATDLENFRSLFESYGYAWFYDCPAIEPVDGVTPQ